MNKDQLIDDIAEFTKERRVEVIRKIRIGPKLIADEWNKKKPETAKEIKTFYKETKNYLYDLALWHLGGRRFFDSKLVQVIQNAPLNRYILDYGCGIGINAFMLAKAGLTVTMADLDSYTFDFAKFMLKKHSIPARVWHVDTEKPPEQMYDIILCFDILEHLPIGSLRGTVNKLIQLKHRRTKVLMTNSFEKTEIHPMHFNLTDKVTNLINKLNTEYKEKEE